MAFGWKVDHIARIVQAVKIIDEHFARPQFLPVACRLILLEIFRKNFFELKGNPPAHDPDTVHGVYQRLGIRAQYIALCQFNHRCLLDSLIIPCFFKATTGLCRTVPEDVGRLIAYFFIQDPDFFHQMPRAGVMDQKFGLFAFLDQRITEIGRY